MGGGWVVDGWWMDGSEQMEWLMYVGVNLQNLLVYRRL